MGLAPPAHRKKQVERALSKESATEDACYLCQVKAPGAQVLPWWSVGHLWHEGTVDQRSSTLMLLCLWGANR